MKQKTVHKAPLTKDDLTDVLQDYPTTSDLKKEISALEIRTDIKMETMEVRIDKKAQKYRDQVLTVMDKVVNELKTMRQEQVMANEHARRMLDRIEGHEVRITKLETTQNHN